MQEAEPLKSAESKERMTAGSLASAGNDWLCQNVAWLGEGETECVGSGRKKRGS